MSIFSKFFEMVRKWFRPSRALPSPTSINDATNNELNANQIVNDEVSSSTVSEAATSSNSVNRIEFVNELKIQKQEESPELLDLQSRFESNQLQLAELTDEELDNLNDLYQRQIDELKQKIYKTKTEINISMDKLEQSSVSA